ncbi:hypothetical protein [Thiomonas sp. FB-6]|uniref:hypothetical protein n=1 Tax=Thiomonas sp. FB-6 TaxID=1158291 RepID=UPI0018CB403D|nr:hypothetical protein [Thiomonas sp. FB-6]
MKITNDLTRELAHLLEQHSRAEIDRALNELVAPEDRPESCTILVNKGLHFFPAHLFVGETFIFSEGSLDLSSAESLESLLISRLKALASFLKSKKWSSVNIIISGHASLCMQVKLAVYRITRIESTDWVFDGAGHYIPLKFSLRSVISSD